MFTFMVKCKCGYYLQITGVHRIDTENRAYADAHNHDLVRHGGNNMSTVTYPDGGH